MFTKPHFFSIAIACLIFNAGCASTSSPTQTTATAIWHNWPRRDQIPASLNDIIEQMAAGNLIQAENALTDDLRASSPTAEYLYAECAALRGDNPTAINRFVEFIAKHADSALSIPALNRLQMIDWMNTTPFPPEKILALRTRYPYAATRLTSYQNNAMYDSGAIYRSPEKASVRLPTATQLANFHWIGPFSQQIYTAFDQPMPFDKDPVLASEYHVDGQTRAQFQYRPDFVTRLIATQKGIYAAETQIHLDRDADVQIIANSNQFYRLDIDGVNILTRDVSDFGKNRNNSATATLTQGDHIIRLKVGYFNNSNDYLQIWIQPNPESADGNPPVITESKDITLTSVNPNQVSNIRRYDVRSIVGDTIESIPSDALQTWLAAMIAITDGNVQIADELLNTRLKSAPNDVVAKYLLAYRYREDANMHAKTRTEKVIGIFKEIEESAPEFGHVHIMLMKILYDEGQAKQALDIYQTYQSYIPDTDYTNALLGDIASKRGWPEIASDYFIKAAQLSPDSCHLNNLALEKMADNHHYIAFEDLNPTLQNCQNIIEHFSKLEGDNKNDSKFWQNALLMLSETYPNSIWHRVKALNIQVRTDPAGAITKMNTLLDGVQKGFYPKPNTAEMLRFVDQLRASKHTAEAEQLIRRLRQIAPVNSSYLTLYWMTNDKKPFEDLRIDGMKTIRDYVALNKTESGPSAGILDYQVTHFNPDGSKLILVHQINRALSKEGKDDLSEISLPDDSAILKLHTIKANTYEIVEPESINYKKSITVPNLAVGDFIELEYVIYKSAPSGYDNAAEDGVFYFANYQMPFVHSEYVLEYPREWQPEIVQSGPKDIIQKDCTNIDDYARCRYYVDNAQVIIGEPNAIVPIDIIPNIQFYHRTGWKEKKQSFFERDTINSRMTPYIEQYYNNIKIPKDASTWEKARVIYEDVVKNIDYDKKFSSDATNTITRGSGSRMYAVKALYDKAGIRNYFAYVHRATAPRNINNLPSHADDGYTFYLIAETEKGPAYIFTDITDTKPFDELSPDVQNAEVIPMVPGMDSFTSRTDSIDHLLTNITIDCSIHPDSSASCKQTQTDNNNSDILRGFLNRFKNDTVMLHQIMQKSIASEYGRVNIKNINYKDLDDKYSPIQLDIEFDIASFATTQDNEFLITKQYSFNLVNAYASVSANERKYPVVIEDGYLFSRTLTFHMPSGYQWQSRTLQNASVNTRFGNYSRDIRISGETLEIKEKIQILPQYIELSDYRDFRDFCLAIDNAQRIELHAIK